MDISPRTKTWLLPLTIKESSFVPSGYSYNIQKEEEE